MKTDRAGLWPVAAVLCVLVLVPSRVAAQCAKPRAVPAKAEKHAPEEKAPDLLRELATTVARLEKLLLEQNRELEAQRAVLREQQEKLARLEREAAQRVPSLAVAAPPAEGAPQQNDMKVLEGQVEAMADNQKELGERVTKMQTDMTAATRSNDGRFRQLGNFRFSGDVRLRFEPFLQAGALSRMRYRVRARFNVAGNITDELYGGITLATGTLDDPISTNQTLTGFFNRKSIGFDHVFVQYRPKWLNNHVTVGAGKFPYPWVRTPMTFDNDVNPEGFYQQVSFDVKDSMFKNITVVGFQLPLFERSGAISTSGATAGQVTTPGYDAWIFGGQIQTRWRVHDRVNLGLHIAGINFVNSDLIATALGAELRPSLPNTNTLRTSGGTTIGYASRFLYLDTVVQADFRTNWSKYPVSWLFNFVNNTRATNIQGSGATQAQTPNRERSGFWTEIQIGRASEQKDIQFGYTFVRIERDALVSAFNESDLRSSTNVRNHRLTFSFMALRNLQLHHAIWIGQLANAQDNVSLVAPRERLPGTNCGAAPFTGCKDTFLKRMQTDLIYRF